MRYLATNFDYIVGSIEEFNNLANMKLEELQASLEAHEIKLKKRNSKREKVDEQTLQATFIKKFGKWQRNNLSNDEKSRNNLKNHSY